jgi:hypothetical protein
MEKLKTFIKREIIILLCGSLITCLVLILCKILNHISLELYGEGSLPYIMGVQAETFLYTLCIMLILGITFVNIFLLIVSAIIVEKEIR